MVGSRNPGVTFDTDGDGLAAVSANVACPDLNFQPVLGSDLHLVGQLELDPVILEGSGQDWGERGCPDERYVVLADVGPLIQFPEEVRRSASRTVSLGTDIQPVFPGEPYGRGRISYVRAPFFDLGVGTAVDLLSDSGCRDIASPLVQFPPGRDPVGNLVMQEVN